MTRYNHNVTIFFFKKLFFCCCCETDRKANLRTENQRLCLNIQKIDGITFFFSLKLLLKVLNEFFSETKNFFLKFRRQTSDSELLLLLLKLKLFLRLLCYIPGKRRRFRRCFFQYFFLSKWLFWLSPFSFKEKKVFFSLNTMDIIGQRSKGLFPSERPVAKVVNFFFYVTHIMSWVG